MFHGGDLSSGIALAIQDGKSVVCFVTDGSEESKKWENEWLQDANVPHALARRAVTLLSQTPTLVIIRQGKLEDQLSSGIGKNDFTLRLMRAMNPDIPRPQTTTTDQPANTAAAVAPTVNSSTPQQMTPQPPPPSTSSTLPDHHSGPTSDTTAARDPDRDKRRKPPDSDPVPSSLPPRPPRANDDYAKEQVQRKQEAKAERDRVRRLVEADKLERRRVREEQEERRSLASQSERQEATTSNAEADVPKSPTTGTCNLQVRLADGSSLRQRFSASDTIQTHVRPWIDSSRNDSTVPYTLKLLQTPLPSKTLTDSDELQSLQSLDLLPSATLILIPVRTFSDAYRAGGANGFMRGLPALIWGYATSGLGWVFGFVGDFVMVGVRAMRGNIEHQERRDAGEVRPAPSREQRGQATGSSAEAKEEEAKRSNVRIRTLRDQTEGRDDRQFYNGNQMTMKLNFEPNKDEDNDKKK
ncbi:MAG: hypothetical protein M1828_005543 [Chrysothrix sp. TS-e1954]|nr:MAG: hypothetical protein M1828_005543 [Chrysothrix sp. TS-e1954]